LVDTAIIGRLGTEELGGLAVAASVLALVVIGSNFLTYGTTQRVANRLGAGRDSDAADVGVQAMWLALIVGAIAVPLLTTAARPLSSILGAEGEILDVAVLYLRISALGVPFVLIALAAQGVQRGAADYRTPLVILVIANLVNLVVELVFVFGFHWGVAGAAWSTVLAQAGAGFAFLSAIRKPLSLSVNRLPDLEGMGPLLTAGKHLLLRSGSMLIVFVGATAVAARIDSATLAAHQITITVFLFMALALDALAVPAQTLVADELGQGTGGAPVIAGRVVRLSVFAGASMAALIAISAPVLPRLFTSDEAVISRATAALVFLAILLLPGALAFAYDGVLIGAADYRFLGRAALAYLVAVVPIAAVVLTTPSLGIAGIWIGLTVWMVLRAVVNRRRVANVLPLVG
ncbi:MAG: MATE family efflux transporter, partial [Actinobacteria bacterium]